MRRGMGCKSPIPRKRVLKLCFYCVSSVVIQYRNREGRTWINNVQHTGRYHKNGMDLWIDNANLDRQNMTFGIVLQNWIDNQDRQGTT